MDCGSVNRDDSAGVGHETGLRRGRENPANESLLYTENGEFANSNDNRPIKQDNAYTSCILKVR